jgi:hypothetical protein
MQPAVFVQFATDSCSHGVGVPVHAGTEVHPDVVPQSGPCMAHDVVPSHAMADRLYEQPMIPAHVPEAWL